MSSFVSAFAAIAPLFGTPEGVILGNTVLTGYEIPQQMPSGGKHAIAVHQMPGGQRVIDMMGRDDDPINWQGTFTGPQAVSRAQNLDAMRIAGASVPLAWGNYSYQVVIASFVPNYSYGGAWVPYSISCIVIQDMSAQAANAAPNLLQSTSNDMASALGITPADLGAVSQSLTIAQTALLASGALNAGTGAFGNALTALTAAQGTLGAAQAATEGSLNGLIGAAAGTAGVLAGGSVGAQIAAVSSAVQATGDLAGLTAASGYLNRVSVNVAGASA